MVSKGIIKVAIIIAITIFRPFHCRNVNENAAIELRIIPSITVIKVTSIELNRKSEIGAR